MIRRLLTLGVILGTLMAISGGAMASSASAASCNATTSAIWYNGSWLWQGVLYNCTGVTSATFNTGAYLKDVTRGGVIHPSSGGGTIGGSASSYAITYQNSIWGSGCGWPAFTVEQWFSFHINGGPNHWVTNAQQLC